MEKPKIAPFVPYKETRLSIEPAYHGSIISLPLPAHGLLNRTFSSPARRQQRSELPLPQDENAFAKGHLATAGSVYVRKGPNLPRCFLWRVLEDGKVLSVQSVDLNKPDKGGQNATIILRFSFPQSIRPGGIAFSDSEHHDPLYIFVLTSSNDLYTLTVRSEFFFRPVATEGNIGDWCKTFLASSFSFRHPHQLTAHTPQQLLVSTHDGGLLKLERKAGDDGSSWVETFYNDGGWGASLRGLIPWQGNNTVRYGSVNLEYPTVTSIALPSDPESPHIFTVTLNHTLKIWNLHTGRISFTRDLLDKVRSPQEAASYVIQPGLSHLVEVFSERLRISDQYYLITLSPKDYRFKFWIVKDADDSDKGLQDLFPEFDFEPSFPGDGSDIWTLSDFRVTPNRSRVREDRKWILWVLWKRNTAWNLMTLEFDPYDVAATWQDKWNSAAFETFPDDKGPKVTDFESIDATEKWLEYIFYPGRFTEAALETTLAIFQQDLNLWRPEPRAEKRMCLKERICSVVSAMVSVDRDHEGYMDFGQYRIDTNKQWIRFSQIALSLEKQQREAISFAYDNACELPLVIMADGVSAIRDCCGIELLRHNTLDQQNQVGAWRDWTSRNNYLAAPILEPARVANLLHAATAFRRRFSASLHHLCDLTLLSELFQDPSYSVPDRMRSFYDRCGFVVHIGDDEYNQLVDTSETFGGLESLDTTTFRAALDALRQKPWKTDDDNKLWMTGVGARMLLRGAQETLHLYWDVLFSLLVLLVFLDVEVQVEDEEEDRTIQLDSATLYLRILSMMKETEVMKCLVKSRLSISQTGGNALSETISRQLRELQSIQQVPPTLFEYIYLYDWPHPPPQHQLRPQTMALAYSIKRTICPKNLTVHYDDEVTWIMCKMIVADNVDLALEFVRFLPNTSWATYLKGRLSLRRQDLSSAATYLKKAAFGLARGRPGGIIGEIESAYLLDLTEIDSINNNGLSRYYLHALGLFEKVRAYSYVAEFANLALQFTNPSNDEVLKSELLSRLFYSSIQTSRFDLAYTAMTQYTDAALQTSALGTLVTHMISQNNTRYMLSLAFLGLHSTVDTILSSLSAKVLSLASAPQYHKVLYSWRISRGDFRGAAEVLFERLQQAQAFTKRGKGSEEENEALEREYLALINLLACVDPAQAWILAKGSGEEEAEQVKMRKVVTLDDVRRGYQKELDRVAMIEGNMFPFGGGGDEMGVLYSP
ncbi:MAG: hypothetical protein M1836_005555 [Candelina mexicana]|nr:MAG: hypothetical protein M1836_005555 [Candelina mexicana]